MNDEIPGVPLGGSDSDSFVITAPVKIPTREQMRVSLVPLHLLTRFEEARSDEHYWGSVFWTLIGATAGTGLTWLMQTPFQLPSAAGQVTLGLLLVSDLVVYRAYNGFRKRADQARTEIANMTDVVAD